MTNDVTKSRTQIAVSKVFDDGDASDEFGAGVSVAFPRLGTDDRQWHYIYKTNDTVIRDAEGAPKSALHVVLVQARGQLNRRFYPPGSYQKGGNNRPICWSSDDIRPDANVPNPINPVCATCPNEAWGSGGTQVAPRAKACQQRKRVAVVPYNVKDLANETGGGPVLLDVPPGSLKNLGAYNAQLRDQGAQPFAVVTQLTFGPKSSIEFRYVKPLNDDEATVVKSLRHSPQVMRVLDPRFDNAVDEGDDAPAAPAPSPAAMAQPQPPRRAADAGARRPPPPPPPRQPVAAAAQPSVPQEPGAVGGFATSTIAEAVNTPAPPPPSQREVVTDDMQGEGAAGAVLSELNDAFGDLAAQFGLRKN